MKLHLLALSIFMALGGCHSTSTSTSTSETQDSSSVFPSDVETPRIMIVGDSISAGPGCYKKYLRENLNQHGISNFEFVGSYSDDCGGGVRHSAVSCSTSADFLKDEFSLPNCFGDKKFSGIDRLMQDNKPDMVMMQLGVNDVWGGATPVDYVLGNYEKLVNKIRRHNPEAVIVVAQIQKIITDNCTNTKAYDNTEQLVQAVPAWASSQSTPQSPVLVADLWTNSDPKEAADCVHPDEAGAERMGLNWYNALKDIL